MQLKNIVANGIGGKDGDFITLSYLLFLYAVKINKNLFTFNFDETIF
jgi:hypothetical protein